MSPTGRLLRASVAGQRWRVLGAAAAFVSWQACESLVPVSIGAIIQQTIGTHDGRRMAWWAALLAAQFLVLSLSFRFGSRLARSAQERAAHTVRVRIAEVVLDPRRVPHPAHRPATTVAVAGNDATRVAALTGMVPRTIGALASILVAAVVLLRISVPLGLLVLVGAPVLLVVVHLLGVPLERRAGAEQEHAAHASALATDLMDGLRVLKGFHGEAAATARYRAASRASQAATMRSATAESAYDAATLLATLAFLALVALVGGRLAAEGHLDVGDLVAAVGLAQFLIGPFAQLSSTGASLARSRASATRVLGVLDVARRSAEGAPLPRPLRGELRLPGLGLTVAPGELVGVVADPGDAARLVDVLATAPYAGEGAVLLDGTDLAVADLTEARTGLLVARHDHQLFADTLRTNVAAAGADDCAVTAALHASDADQVAATLRNGLDDVLGERGRSLSGGQRQRVALARALAADPPVLVLHDPTTAVDAATGSRIAERLAALRQGRTTVLVTTDPALLARCDRVVVLRGGAVDAQGRHEELVARASYQELVLS